MRRQSENIRGKLKTRRTSITWKLFFVTAVVFLTFISAVLVFESLFVDEFYHSAKERSSLKGIDEFCGGYAKGDWSRSTLDGKIAAMADVYDIQLIITDLYGRNLFGAMEMVVGGKDGRETVVDLSGISLIDDLKADGLQKGGDIKLKGEFNEDGSKLKPFEIGVGRSEWRHGDTAGPDNPVSRPVNAQSAERKGSVQLEGTIEYLRLMNENEYEDPKSPFAVLKTALEQWQEEHIKIPEQRRIMGYKDTATGNEYRMFIFPVTMKNGSKEAIFAIVPMQPVDEAVGVIRDYLKYVFPAALVIVLFLSYLYSLMVARPLIKINAAASRMSNMDFDVRCGIHSRDELGSLSNSLNTMSSRLNSTITELKEFVSNASHELKTPIAAMGGYVEALRDDIRKDKRERYLERLQHEIVKMNSLVQNMLELSRMESDTLVLHEEAFDLRNLTGEILEEFSACIWDKRIKLTRQDRPEPAVVFGERARLGQVIRNFMSNALKHTADNGEIWIDIVKEEGGFTFCIENRGSNIPEEKIGRIWERFYRIEPSRDKDSGGTGLGLAIASKILQLHHAQYGAKNTEKGVLFHFTLPVG